MGAKSKQLVLSVEHVGVAYHTKAGLFKKEAFWALKDVSFDVFHGETLGVIGRNGVGKSTLLRLLAGIVAPDKGKVVNHDVTVSLLSLQAGFLGHLTGRENVILSGMMLGLSKREVMARMDEIEAYADIGGHFDRPVQGYSSGMRARVGFSVAIYVDADVILLDEVLGVGDIDFRSKSSATIKEKMKSDKTVVLVSHNPGLMKQLCDRAIWIEGGCVRAQGAVEEVTTQYENSFGR